MRTMRSRRLADRGRHRFERESSLKAHRFVGREAPREARVRAHTDDAAEIC